MYPYWRPYGTAHWLAAITEIWINTLVPAERGVLKDHVHTKCSLESLSHCDVHPAPLNKMSGAVKSGACGRWVGKN